MARTISEILARARGTLTSQGIESASIDAQILLSHCLGIRIIDLVIHRDQEVADSDAQAYEGLVARRAAREPVAYITGEKEFYGRPFAVSRHVLIPRPETEILVEQALLRAPRGGVVLEIGVGSGAVICSVLAERTDLTGLGNDISIEAVRVARSNALKTGVSERLGLFVGDLFSALHAAFPVILANPPYIPETEEASLDDDVRIYEPGEALFGGKDGIDKVKGIITGAKACLAEGGVLVMEFGVGQKQAVENLVSGQEGIVVSGWENDLAGIPRAVIMAREHG